MTQQIFIIEFPDGTDQEEIDDMKSEVESIVDGYGFNFIEGAIQ